MHAFTHRKEPLSMYRQGGAHQGSITQ